MKNDTDEVKKNIIDRCSLQEVLSIKKDFQMQIDQKVQLKEVQQALNEFQGDLTEQLTGFKQKIQDKIIAQEMALTRLIERKADHKELKQLHDDKLNKNECMVSFAPK